MLELVCAKHTPIVAVSLITPIPALSVTIAHLAALQTHSIVASKFVRPARVCKPHATVLHETKSSQSFLSNRPHQGY